MSRDRKPTAVDAEFTDIVDDIARIEARARATLSSQQTFLEERIRAAGPRSTELEAAVMLGIELSCRLSLDGRDDDARDARTLVSTMISFAKEVLQARGEAVYTQSALIGAHVDTYVENMQALGQRWESKTSEVSATKSVSGRALRSSEYDHYRVAFRTALLAGRELNNKKAAEAFCDEVMRKLGDDAPEPPSWNTMRTWLRPRKKNRRWGT